MLKPHPSLATREGTFASGRTAMATTTTTAPLGVHEKLNRAPSRLGILIFGGVMILGLIFIGASIARDLSDISLGSA